MPIPSIINLNDGETFHQRLLIVYGRAGENKGDTSISVKNLNSTFPLQRFSCVDSHWKALCHLEPGLNTLIFEHHVGGRLDGETRLSLTYLPLLQNPPLSLALLVAADSELKFDVPKHKEGKNCLNEAIKRFRLSAYLWQAFTAEQMWRNGFGRKTFRLDEAWLPDTLSHADDGSMRTTAKVYTVRSKRTMAELRGRNLAQQKHDASTSTTGPAPTQAPGQAHQSHEQRHSTPDLYSIFMEALSDYGAPFDKQCYVAGLILDTHWDQQSNAILGHAALGGGGGNIRLGMFGSHLVHGWPEFIEEIERCLLDITPNDISRTANDNGETGVAYKAFCIGSGAFLHEVGHALTLTHTPTGLMSRGFNHFNRTFMTLERTPNGDRRPVTPSDEEGSHWHRADVVRLRYHPCLRLPGELLSACFAGSPSVYITPHGLFIRSPLAITLLEWEIEGRGLVKWQDFAEDRQEPLELVISVDLDRIRGGQPGGKISLEVTCCNQQSARIEDVEAFMRDGCASCGQDGRKILKSNPVGQGRSGGQKRSFKVYFNAPGRKLVQVTCYTGHYLHGIDFSWSNGTHDCIGRPDGTRHQIPVLPGSQMNQIVVRAGFWVDGCEVILQTPGGLIRSGWCGGTGGAEPVYLSAPPGCAIMGVFGSAGDFIDSLGILYQ